LTSITSILCRIQIPNFRSFRRQKVSRKGNILAADFRSPAAPLKLIFFQPSPDNSNQLLIFSPGSAFKISAFRVQQVIMVSYPSASSQLVKRNSRRLASLCFLSPPSCFCHLLHTSCLGCNHWQLVFQHPVFVKVKPAFTERQPDAKYLSGLNCSLRYQRQRQRCRFAAVHFAQLCACPAICNRLPNKPIPNADSICVPLVHSSKNRKYQQNAAPGTITLFGNQHNKWRQSISPRS